MSAAALEPDPRGARLEGFFPYRLAVTAERFSRALALVYGEDFGLGREEWRMLFLLAGEEEVSSLELARRTTLDKVQVSRTSQRLEERGLISRKVSDSDRRLRVFSCTEEGRALFARALPVVEARAQGILARMDPKDIVALSQGLDAMMHALAEDGPEG